MIEYITVVLNSSEYHLSRFDFSRVNFIWIETCVTHDPRVDDAGCGEVLETKLICLVTSGFKA